MRSWTDANNNPAFELDLDPEHIPSVEEWACFFSRLTCPGDALGRFTIGHYQIGQLLNYIDHQAPIEDQREAAGAAVIHLIGAARLRGAYPSAGLPNLFKDIEQKGRDFRVLTKSLARCAQIHGYWTFAPSGSTRQNRFSTQDLEQATAAVITEVMCEIWPTYRKHGIELAIAKLLDKEWTK